jgi:hypothetical protein
MKKYIFITPEGLSFKPNMDSPEPDYLDLQIFDFNHDSSIQDAIQDLIELNHNAKCGQPEGPIALRIENNRRKSFWLREKKNSCTAS